MDLFTKISKCEHHLGIFATFTIDQNVIEKLREHSVARMYIMHDIKHGMTAKSTDDSRLCIRPAKIAKNDAPLAKFHPKVVLLIGENKAAIGVGSANLTKDSFLKSKETFAWIEVEKSCFEIKLLVEWLKRFAMPGWESVFKEASVLSAKNTHEKSWRFLHNQHEPLSSQLLRILREDWKCNLATSTIQVVSPFLSKDSKNNITEWFDSISTKKKIIYARKNQSAEVLTGSNIYVKFPKEKREGFHSKQIMFEWPEQEKAVLFMGSANFTNQGFFMAEKDDGNAECGFLMILSDEKYRAWKKDWFDTGWEAECIVKQDDIKKLPEQDSPHEKSEPYCWAETSEDGKTITLWVACAEKQTIKIIKPKILNPDFQNQGLSLQTCSFKTSALTIKVKVGKEEIDVPVLNKEEFNNAYNESAASLFGAATNPRRISVKDILHYYKGLGENNQRFLAPAALDKFHQLWKIRFENVKRKKYLSTTHFEELKETLKKLVPAEKLYVIFHMLLLVEKFKDSGLEEFLKSEEKKTGILLFGRTNYPKWEKMRRQIHGYHK